MLLMYFVYQIFLMFRTAFIFISSAFVIFIMSQWIVSKHIFIQKDKLIYNLISIVFVETIINIFVKNIIYTLVISNILFYVLSIGFYFLHEFRGNNLNFEDIFCIATAKEVASGYKYNIKIQFIISIIISVLTLLLYNKLLIINYGAMIVYRLVLAIIFYTLIVVICSQNKFNYSLNAGEVDGYIYNFISSCPIFYISKNKNINNVNLDGSIEKNENISIHHNEIDNNKEKPHVIVIMNESFSHINERIKTNIPVTPIYDNLKGVLKGNMIVNTFGGGTETTEFEFLTSMHVGNNPYPIYPYNHIKSEKYTMARFFDNNGYKTIAMHPYTATNYHRNVIYKLFGFDEMCFYDEFKHKDTVRNYVSDDAMYDEVIDKYQETKQNNKKAFIFGITMQNHSGYDTFSGQEIEVLDDIKNKKSVDSYLSLLHISDKSIKKLIDYFDKENDRVLICFFGDHNASFNPDINKMYYDISKNYEGKNVYETPFFIYDNKNKQDENIKKISSNFLAVELLKRTGLEMTEYYKFINEIYERVYFMNFHKEKIREDNKMYYINDREEKYINYRDGYLK